MKRWLCLLLAILVAMSLFACGAKSEIKESNGDSVTDSAAVENAENEETESSEISVDEGLFNVTLTLPADFVDEGITQEELDESAREEGFKSATLNNDGSVTYVMTKSQHDKMMHEIQESIDTGIEEMVGSEDYPNYVSIEANSDYTQYKIVTKSQSLGLDESFSVLAFYMYSGMYHAFNGTEIDNVNIQFINESTGEIIEEANSSDLGS